MTWRTILAIIAFVGVCGFIAYWGDLLGRRMGKRRLSLFGMRPRYTAIIVTTMTGMLIALLTAGFTMIISEDARRLFLEGEAMLRERPVIIRRYEAAVRASRKAARESEQQKLLAAEARKGAKNAIRERNRLANERDRISRDLGQLRIDLKRNEAGLRKAEQRLAVAERSLGVSERELNAARKDVASRRTEIESQKNAIAGLEAQRSELDQQISRATAVVNTMLEKRIIFQSRQEIARRAIRCSQPKDDIQAEVLALLDDASKKAEALEAKTGDNNRAVAIRAKQFVSDDPKNTRFASETESISAVVDQISGSIGTVVVRVLSWGNCYQGEQAVVDFVLNPNRLIYAAGDEVARAVIDGSASPGQILGALIGFLKSEVRYSAEWKGSIPIIDEEGQASVGDVSGDQLWDAVNRVKAAGKPVQVRAVAKSEAWSADRLNLNFVIGDAE